MRFQFGQMPLKPSYPGKHVFSTESCRDENSLNMPNCVDECCVGPGERPANRLIGEGKAETFQLCKALTCTTKQQVVARAKEVIRKEGRHLLFERWKTRGHDEQTEKCTYDLIPELATRLDIKHGEVSFYPALALSGHGYFNAT